VTGEGDRSDIAPVALFMLRPGKGAGGLVLAWRGRSGLGTNARNKGALARRRAAPDRPSGGRFFNVQARIIVQVFFTIK
jgi:hypothetical protein